jgi:N-acetylmuramoyl-L-alanine amidase
LIVGLRARLGAELGVALLLSLPLLAPPMPAIAAESVPLPVPAPRGPMSVAQDNSSDPLAALLERVSAPTSQQNMPVVIDFRLGEEGERTRLVVELSDPVGVQVFTLTEPNRVVIDMPEVLWRNPQNDRPTGSGTVQSYRYGLFREGNSRFVIDLNAPVSVSAPQLLPPDGGFGFRLVLDLYQTSIEDFVANAGWPQEFRGASGFGRPVVQSEMAEMPARDPGPAVAQSEAPIMTAKRTIVVDAGHGGVDPGTHGASGMQEKTIVLAVAKKLRETLEATGRYSVHLTRETDIFIPLRGRVDIARAAGADLFLSLHVDSHVQRDIRGASVYTLSEDGSDREAARLAEKENMSDVIAGVDLAREDNPVASILIDLAQRNTMNRSVRFAKTVLTNLSRSTYIRPTTPRRSAGFAVLKAPDVPAVLIELGYLTNQTDEREMATDAWRFGVAGSISAAVDAYFGVGSSSGTIQAAIP